MNPLLTYFPWKNGCVVASVFVTLSIAGACFAQNPCIWEGGYGNWFPPGTARPHWFAISGGIPVSCVPSGSLTADIGNASGAGSFSGTVNLNQPVSIEGVALGTGAGGELLVSSAANTLSADSLFVGVTQNGNLAVQSGGVVTARNVNIGAAAGSNGTVVVDGTGSQLTSSGYFNVGNVGSGTLTISDGGKVSATALTIAASTGSLGRVTVIGANSQLNTSSPLFINPNGVLEVLNGGAVSSGAVADEGLVTISNGAVLNTAAGSGGFIGVYRGGGSVLITNPGSKWNTSGLQIGSGGPGALTISNAAVVDSKNSYVGSFGGNGNVLVTDVGSLWSISSLVVGGTAARGSVTIQNGAVVNGGNIFIGGSKSLSGSTMTVDGAGSQLLGSFLNVGAQVNGTLTLRNSGGVKIDGAGDIGYNAGVTGTAMVNGTGSQWITSGLISVGVSGQGLLTVQNGARVNSGGLYLAYATGSNGNVSVTGAGSELTTSFAEVGLGGKGAMFIDASAAVTVAGTTVIGRNGNGIVTISGAGSQWTNSGSLDIGLAGKGNLTVSSDGSVHTASAILGFAPGSAGDVLVDAGNWHNAGSLSIGVGGAGSVTVESGGSLSTGSLSIGSHGSLLIDPSTVRVAGNFSLASGGLLLLTATGSSPSSVSGLDISGFGLFEGTVDMDFTKGFAPEKGDIFKLITSSGGANFSGAKFNIEGLAPGFEYTDSYSDDQFVLTALNNGISTTPIPEL